MGGTGDKEAQETATGGRPQDVEDVATSLLGPPGGGGSDGGCFAIRLLLPLWGFSPSPQSGKEWSGSKIARPAKPKEEATTCLWSRLGLRLPLLPLPWLDIRQNPLLALNPKQPPAPYATAQLEVRPWWRKQPSPNTIQPLERPASLWRTTISGEVSEEKLYYGNSSMQNSNYTCRLRLLGDLLTM